MSQDLVSSAPGIYQAMLTLVQQAAAAQNPVVSVFPFELGQYEPGSYVTLHAIENHRFEWAYIPTFTQYEYYDITGVATVFTGDSPADNPTVATTVLNQTYSLFQNVVMTPVISNRDMPIFQTQGPSPLMMLPEVAQYTAGVGNLAGGPGGWVGTIDFRYSFTALVTPA